MVLILLTGGTGTLGQRLVPRLRDAGCAVRILSRHGPDYAIDLRSGAGLDQAMDGVNVVVHCATGTRGDLRAADNLIAAAKAADIHNLVYTSIVGVDRVDFGYYRAKLDVERRLAQSGLPHTVLRTTQFHDLVFSLLRAAARPPIMLVAKGIRVQPIEVDEVAARLADLAMAPPFGRVEDMGGPQVRDISDLARVYLRYFGKRRPIVPVWLPGKAFAGYRRGGHLAPDHRVGTGTFEDFLATK